jgi:hypothetical protein
MLLIFKNYYLYKDMHIWNRLVAKKETMHHFHVKFKLFKKILNHNIL